MAKSKIFTALKSFEVTIENQNVTLCQKIPQDMIAVESRCSQTSKSFPNQSPHQTMELTRKVFAGMPELGTCSSKVVPMISPLPMEDSLSLSATTITTTEEIARDGTISERMKLDQGYISPYFITNQETQTCELVDPLILIHEKKISTINAIVNILEVSLKRQRHILIIADDVESDALETLIANKVHAGIMVCAVRASGSAENRKSSLQELAVLTGGEVMSEELGLMNLVEAGSDILGSCKKVTISKDDTTILKVVSDTRITKEEYVQMIGINDFPISSDGKSATGLKKGLTADELLKSPTMSSHCLTKVLEDEPQFQVSPIWNSDHEFFSALEEESTLFLGMNNLWLKDVGISYAWINKKISGGMHSIREVTSDMFICLFNSLDSLRLPAHIHIIIEKLIYDMLECDWELRMRCVKDYFSCIDEVRKIQFWKKIFVKMKEDAEVCRKREVIGTKRIELYLDFYVVNGSIRGYLVTGVLGNGWKVFDKGKIIFWNNSVGNEENTLSFGIMVEKWEDQMKREYLDKDMHMDVYGSTLTLQNIQAPDKTPSIVGTYMILQLFWGFSSTTAASIGYYEILLRAVRIDVEMGLGVESMKMVSGEEFRVGTIKGRQSKRNMFVFIYGWQLERFRQQLLPTIRPPPKPSPSHVCCMREKMECIIVATLLRSSFKHHMLILKFHLEDKVILKGVGMIRLAPAHFEAQIFVAH